MTTEFESNPFVLLAISTSASNQDVLDALDDLMSAESADQPSLAQAKQALLTPRLRLRAELGFLIDTPDGEVRRLLESIQARSVTSDQQKNAAARLAPLSRSNFLTHIAQSTCSDVDLLVALVGAQAEVNVSAVVAAVNKARSRAGIVPADQPIVELELTKWFDHQFSKIFDRYHDYAEAAKDALQTTTRILLMKDDRRLERLDTLQKFYWQSLSQQTSKIRSKLSELKEAIALAPTDATLMSELQEVLKAWDRLAKPLQLLEQAKGRDEPETSDIFKLIRGLCVELSVEHNRPDVALPLIELAIEVFAKLPRASDRLAQDREDLKSLMLQNACQELYAFAQRTKQDTSSLARALTQQGASGASAKQLFDLLNDALGRLNEPVDIPWLIVRDISISLFNDDNDAESSFRLTSQLLNHAIARNAPIEIVTRLRVDLQAVEVSVLEKKAAQLVSERAWSQAIRVTDKLIALSEEATAQSSYREVRSKLKGRQLYSRAKYAFCGIGILFVVAGVINDKNSRQPSSYPQQSSSGALPTTPSRSPLQPPSPRLATNEAAEHYAEVKPATPQGAPKSVFSRENLRYCLFERARLEHVRTLLRQETFDRPFNEAVDDWNKYCSEYQYRQPDRDAVEAEVKANQFKLRDHARERVDAWRLGVLPVNTLPSQTAFPQPTISQAPKVDLPPVIIDIDLVLPESAVRVQKRLAELGYFKGAADGTWGPASRAAMRAFNIANAQNDTDKVDVTTATQLFSSTATVAPTYTPPASYGYTEASYPGVDGAKLNPLNRLDAININSRLRTLGLYRGQNEGLWSGVSRAALRAFKQQRGLAVDDKWNAETEAALLSAETAKLSIGDAAFELAVTGTWATNPAECSTTRTSSTFPITITAQKATAGTSSCQFQNKQGTENAWSVQALCQANEKSWQANIKLVRIGNTLQWTSERGNALYYRC